MDDPVPSMDAAEWDRTVQEAARAAKKHWRGAVGEWEDFRNEVVVRLMRYRHSGVTRAALFGLALAIARNLQTDWDRARINQPRERSIDRGPAPRTPQAGRGDAEKDADHSALIQALVQSLTPEERVIVRLCIVDGQPLRAAAAAIGMPEATLRRRLQHAVDIMERVRRAWVGEDEKDDAQDKHASGG